MTARTLAFSGMTLGAALLAGCATARVPADDNGLTLIDGSIVGPGNPQTGMQRAAVFPYIGARNTNPSGLPGGNPPP